MPQIDWSLLGPPVNYGEKFMQGMQAGRQMVQQRDQQNALAALATNPDDQNALATLFSTDPATAVRMQAYGEHRKEQQRQDSLRAGLAGAYDPATGHIDPTAARRAYVDAGDVPGAVAFDASQAELAGKLTKTQQDQIKIGARLLANVTDEQSYQTAREIAKSHGIDLSNVPETYDANYVKQVVSLGQSLDGGEEYSLAPGAIRMRGNQVIAQSPYAPTITAEGVTYERTPSQPTTPGAPNGGTPRGIRNNNPGNIEDGPFARSQPGYKGSDGRYAIFADAGSGQAATNALLGNYLQQGVNTPAKIIGRWAPASENGQSTSNYTAYVAQRLGINPNDPIPPDKVPMLAQAMHEFETGEGKQGGGLRQLTPSKAPPKPKPSETRVLNGKTYYKIDGRWFDNAEGA
jgi:hypothetical protein